MGADDMNHEEELAMMKRAPHTKPPFTLNQLKKAIPPHCFNRSLLRSFSYVFHDIALVSIFSYMAMTYVPHLPSPLSLLAWPLYWTLQGCVFTGIWVLAHECSHHAFSDYQWVDDTVGFILHSSIMIPYFSLKYSHKRHHANTGSIERDEIFIPRPKSQVPWYSKYFNNPPGRAITLLFTLAFGEPLYLAFNVSGRRYGAFACHFIPYESLCSYRKSLEVFASDLGIFATSYALYRLSLAKGIAWAIRFYGVPLLVSNASLVIISYLQHTHSALPHYDSSEWDWLRGALSTVDRDFGILNKVFHNITDTHVAHHLFSTMPHYHAMEATRAIKPILGEYYSADGMPFYKAMWRETKECLYAEPDEDGTDKGVFWYRNSF